MTATPFWIGCIRSKGIPVPNRKTVIKTICNKNVFVQYVLVDGKSKLKLGNVRAKRNTDERFIISVLLSFEGLYFQNVICFPQIRL